MGKSGIAYQWRQYFQNLESCTQHSTHTDKDKICCGPKTPKTLKQRKDKIRNFKDSYIVARDHNKRTGVSPMYYPYYQEFEEVLHIQDLMNTPFAKEWRC